MLHRSRSLTAVLVVAVAILTLGGCLQGAPQDGVHVMFDSAPPISGDSVYWHSRTIGRIRDIQVGANGIARVTVMLDAGFKQLAGHNWAFYVSRGRLMADRLSVSGQAVAAGEPVCGFSSRAAFKWFKFKTLLKDRVANAIRRADSLQRRFG